MPMQSSRPVVRLVAASLFVLSAGVPAHAVQPDRVEWTVRLGQAWDWVFAWAVPAPEAVVLAAGAVWDPAGYAPPPPESAPASAMPEGTAASEEPSDR